MDWLGIFRRRDAGSASLAKERLQVLVAHRRSGRGDHPDFLDALHRDMIRAIGRYVPVGDDAVTIQVERSEDIDVLEINITIPDP